MSIKSKTQEEPITQIPQSSIDTSDELVIHKATRKLAKIRIGLCGTSGAGKTFSAILIAKGLGKKIVLVDTENGSGDLYAKNEDYDVMPIYAPFTVEKYMKAIDIAEREGYDVLILDTISHAWAGQGGLLERQNFESKRTGNSYTAWATITPLHQRFVEKMLSCKLHLIATMRSKPEYVIDKDASGRTSIRKLGLAPVQREGMDHEFTIVFDLDSDHNAYPSKDRTSMFDGQSIKPSEETGKKILKWLGA